MKTLVLLALAGFAGTSPVFAETAATPEKAAGKERKFTAGGIPIVGREAPAFTPTGWIKGEPVAAYEKGKVYLIECWATWCGPCCAQIPHLNELHKKYEKQGLVIIGINVMDTNREAAEAFVKKKGDGMSYRVAYDKKSEGIIEKNWLVARMTGIPHAFVVRDGLMLWQGHPKELTDADIETMLAGQFDWKKAQRKQADAMAERRNAGTILKEIDKLIGAKEYEEAVKKLEGSADKFPESSLREAEIAFFKIDLATGKSAEAVKRLDQFAASKQTDLELQNRICGDLLTAPLRDDPHSTRLAVVIARRLNANPDIKGHVYERAFGMTLQRAVAIDSGKPDPYPPRAH